MHRASEGERTSTIWQQQSLWVLLHLVKCFLLQPFGSNQLLETLFDADWTAEGSCVNFSHAASRTEHKWTSDIKVVLRQYVNLNIFASLWKHHTNNGRKRTWNEMTVMKYALFMLCSSLSMWITLHWHVHVGTRLPTQLSCVKWKRNNEKKKP